MIIYSSEEKNDCPQINKEGNKEQIVGGLSAQQHANPTAKIDYRKNQEVIKSSMVFRFQINELHKEGAL
jgi:hypothetical protein